MKKIALALSLVACFTFSVQAEEWFGMETCEICKPMSGHMHLMEVLKWETHMIPNGFLSISVIPAEHKEEMEKVHAEMEKVIARAEEGEQMELCGHCQSWGKLLEAGAQKTELETVGGHITMLTSDDAKVVKKIQAHAQRSLDEFKKMMETQPTS